MQGPGIQPRGATVLVGAVLIALLGLGVTVAPVPYVVLQPGPTVDTLGERDGVPVIEIEGEGLAADGTAGENAGELRLTTVSVRPDISVLDAVWAWFDDEEAVVPAELVYPPGQSRQEVEERNTEQFTRSQSAAEAAAMRHLGYPVRVSVADVAAGGPAAGVLAPGDIITAVDGTEVNQTEDLTRLVSERPVGTTLEVEYERDGEPATAKLTTAPDPEDANVSRIGVVITAEVDHPYELTIELDRIGGPSAGLMFALGIIDKIDPEDLTGGRIIAGTGSITADGEVGPIGGVPQKLVAARAAGATAFLVPAANCPEAVANAPDGLILIEVETLTDALDGLAALRAGEEPETCD